MTFYLGTCTPSWIARVTVPLFISHERVKNRKTFPVATCDWCLDSGGFSQLTKHDKWTVPAKLYAANARRMQLESGRMQWAAVQDWMCEPHMLVKTGLTVAEHQRRTIDSYLELRSLEPCVPWAPVLQGWEPGDYMSHLEQYDRAGVDLRTLPVVGLGSVCRRQSTAVMDDTIRYMHGIGVKLHGFGFKITGLRRIGEYLASSDSQAWSMDARYRDRLPGHTHLNCANCLEYAMMWREKVVNAH